MKQRFITLAFLLVLVLMIGSGLAIEPGKAGDPMTGADDPDLVLQKLEVSVIKRDFDEYRSVLSDSFVYVADLGTVSMYPDIKWDHWGLTKEEGFLTRLMSPVLKCELNLTDNITERGMPYNKEARYEITYMLKIQGKKYVGSGLFVFEEINQRWFLLRWEEIMPITDKSTGTFFTNSGEVRASLIP